MIHLSFRGSMLFCIEKPRGLITTLLSWEIGVVPSIWLGLRGSWYFCHVYYIFCFSLASSSYSPKSCCFTCYTGLYLLNYAYHCVRMSSNEM
jgi:hypothetical protein